MKIFNNLLLNMAELKFPEVLPDKIEYTQKIADKMDTIFKDTNAVAPFLGDVLIANLFYSYLFHKYGMKCYKGREKLYISFYLDVSEKDTSTINDPDNVPNLESCVNILSNCITNINPTQLVIIPLDFKLFNNDDLIGGHANLLIYRPESRELEHFEPHGSKYDGPFSVDVNRKLKKILTKIVNDVNKTIADNTNHIKLINSADICPTKKFVGLQGLEGSSKLAISPTVQLSGYCEAWSMFFAELCLKNPTISTRDVYTAIMKQASSKSSTSNMSDYLRTLIRGYTVFINNKIAKYFAHIFNEPGLNNKKLIDIRLQSSTELDKDALQIVDKWMNVVKAEYPTYKNGKFKSPLLNETVRKRFSEFKKNITPGTSPEDKKHRQMDDTPTDVNRSFRGLNISNTDSASTSPISQQRIHNRLFSASTSPISQQRINNRLFSASPTINEGKTTKQSPILFNSFDDKFITKRRRGKNICDSSLKRCSNGCTRNKRNKLCEPTNIKK